MSKTISQSIGKSGYNTSVEDIKTVQALLNKVPATQGGPAPLLLVEGKNWGRNWERTLQAIVSFQKAKFGGWFDGRIDPEAYGGMTMRELNRYDGHAPGGIHRHKPPSRPQGGATTRCWAAALSSWMTATRRREWSTEDVIDMFGAYCDISGALNPNYLSDVTESIFVRMDYEDIRGADLTPAHLGELLKWSDVYMIQWDGGRFSHAYVVYGFDDLMHIMDPMRGFIWMRLDALVGTSLKVGCAKGRLGGGVSPLLS